MKSGIYKITNLKNGKFYIGSSKDIERRWWEHTNELDKNIHINKKLQNAWNFYGKDNFKFEIIEELKNERAAVIKPLSDTESRKILHHQQIEENEQSIQRIYNLTKEHEQHQKKQGSFWSKFLSITS